MKKIVLKKILILNSDSILKKGQKWIYGKNNTCVFAIALFKTNYKVAEMIFWWKKFHFIR